MTTYKELRERALTDPDVRAEYDRLSREAFASLDAMLGERQTTTHVLAVVAERTGTKATSAK
ncbi:hypothetical protein [Burkholderia sp. BCC1977]|uniref:hypothetical protein n=1 Tax=Burkholderia sp. BCC1977 TaxID=2817440 RepID=UPI002ABDE5C4|nr:hypothetical protein [Burkholderia sp. BCC1977]